MRGQIVARALQAHFDTVCRAELERRHQKLGGLNRRDRESVESIIGEVIGALARRLAAPLTDADHAATLDVIVQLFGLERPGGSPRRSEA
jgi:hypothetical protein